MNILMYNCIKYDCYGKENIYLFYFVKYIKIKYKLKDNFFFCFLKIINIIDVL